jgi:hypothetical protein
VFGLKRAIVGSTVCQRIINRLTAGVTGKGGTWQKKPPGAESASLGRFPESAGKAPHKSGAPYQDGGPSFFPKEHNTCPENSLLGWLFAIR